MYGDRKYASFFSYFPFALFTFPSLALSSLPSFLPSDFPFNLSLTHYQRSPSLFFHIFHSFFSSPNFSFHFIFLLCFPGLVLDFPHTFFQFVNHFFALQSFFYFLIFCTFLNLLFLTSFSVYVFIWLLVLRFLSCQRGTLKVTSLFFSIYFKILFSYVLPPKTQLPIIYFCPISSLCYSLELSLSFPNVLDMFFFSFTVTLINLVSSVQAQLQQSLTDVLQSPGGLENMDTLMSISRSLLEM